MKIYCLEVRGDFACFTRPEMKVERVSYDVMTPSSARAVFESILWKPAIRWHIDKIEVLKPIRWVSIRRNEVGAVISVRNAQEAMNKGTGCLGLNIEDERQQRAGLFLRDVAYRIHAHFELQPDAGENNTPAKFLDMFERRAEKGQCVNQPYLGCREFACDFRLIDPMLEQSNPVKETRDLGWMLYDMDYSNAADPQPRFFRATLENGILNVPVWNSQEVRG
ncbi:MAG TPA: type I-C CRISPR-associated protein Cas5c [Nitrosomonas sp.]|nr:type I-C CRISPR-associated protein Cas5c [Nitrosomonas sp.]HNO53458.1 type I-C CRISPR-associated protein Cas5c [Cyclobacteriaceae bacterium]HMW20875.1 type I-C CRISPR-associated protein Cas5c [Nitrosomonas sp.]HMW68675.1 type I-C CRISPR-associated protein Cas5c [Nitrosomonas sp.]HMY60734.1 type I-C CRISPR-associated protein Cas5c [Nitrosomonas sp.]